MYSVKAACQLTGISPEVMRAWERRYGAIRPVRDDKNRRVYDSSEISRLRLLRSAVDHGHPIRRVAQLPSAELEELLATKSDGERSESANRLVKRLLDAAESYRPDLCDEILGLAIAGYSPLDAAQLVITPALVEAGERWHSSRMTVAQEHLLTASVERNVITIMHTYQKTMRGPGMLFSTLAGERHVIGSLLAGFLAASQGIRCLYLGPDLSVEELVVAASRSEVRVVALSFVVDSPEIERHLNRLANDLPRNVEIWVGGAGIQDLSEQSLPKKCSRFANFELFLDRIQFMRDMTN